MPRPNQRPERRLELIPIVASAFAELGYRRTTTAELAERCDVRENILYRLWPDKRAMFVAALDYVYELSESTWAQLDAYAEKSAAQQILEYEAAHHGEFGFYRIVFAGLPETEDPEIAKAMKRLYRRFQRFIAKQVEAHRGAPTKRQAIDASSVAWAIVGLGTVANIGRELGLISARERKRLVGDVGRVLLDRANESS